MLQSMESHGATEQLYLNLNREDGLWAGAAPTAARSPGASPQSQGLSSASRGFSCSHSLHLSRLLLLPQAGTFCGKGDTRGGDPADSVWAEHGTGISEHAPHLG